MALDAGTVYATLGGRFNPAGFVAFDRAMNNSHGRISRFDAALLRSTTRGSRALHTLGTAAGYGAAGGIVGLGIALVGTVKKAADFESQLSSLQAVTRANSREMGLLRDQAMKAGAATKFSALDAARAQTELAKGGLSTQKILSGGLKGALALAAAGEMELAEAAAVTANALNLFGLNGSQATHVADALASAANATTADVGDFARALVQGGAAAKAAGLDLDQTVVALEALARSGVKGSDAGTSLKAMLTQLASPTAEAAQKAKDLGLHFFTAEGNMRSLPAISRMLGKEFGELTRQQRLEAATTLVGTDGMRALLSLYDAGPEQLRRYGIELGRSGSAADMAAKKQDNLKGKLENLKGSIETAAITVGTELIPVLTESAEDLTDWINRAAKSGDIERFGRSLVNGFEAGAQAVPKVAGAIGDIGQAGADAYQVVQPLIGLIADIPTGALIGAAAGFAAFRVAAAVAPGVAALATAIGDVILAARAGGALFALSTIASMAGPVGLAAAAFVTLGAVIGIAMSRESEEEAIAKRVAAAKRDQAAAIRDLSNAENGVVDGKLGLQRANLSVEQAEARLNQLRKDGKRGTLEYQDAQLSLAEAKVRASAAAREYGKALKDENDGLVRTRHVAGKNLADRQRELRDLEKRIAEREGQGASPRSDPDVQRRLADAQRNYNDALDAFVKANTRASISQLNMQRISAGTDKIAERNAEGFKALNFAITQTRIAGENLPKKIETKFVTDDQDTVAKLGILAGRLAAMRREKTVARVLTTAPDAQSAVKAFDAVLKGVPARKVIRILQNADTAREAIRLLRAEINALHDKTVTITTLHIAKNIAADAARPSPHPQPGRPSGRAAGRGRGGSERALVGEGLGAEYVIDPETGKVGRVDQPTLMDLPASAYVVPTEQRYRNRGIGLLAQAAAELGIAAFGGGRKPKKPKSWPVPANVSLGGVPFEDVENDYQAKREAYQQAKKDRQSHETQVANAKHRLDRVPKGASHARERANARDAWNREKKELAAARAAERRRTSPWKKAEAYWQAAKKTDDRVKDLESEINLARDRMADANRKHDREGYTAARKDRKKSIADLIAVLQQALGSANPASDHARGLRERLSQLGGDPAVKGATENFDGEFGDPELSDDETAPDEQADRVEAGGLTDDEQSRLDELEARLATAEVDTPDDIGDDRTALEQLLAFREGIREVIAGDLDHRGGQAALAQAIRDVGSVRDQIKDLNDSAAGDDTRDADVQAQLDQANRRAEVAEETSRLDRAALSTFQGAGSLIQNNYMLHPSDPTVLERIGRAATAGQSLQPSRRSPREFTGA